MTTISGQQQINVQGIASDNASTIGKKIASFTVDFTSGAGAEYTIDLSSLYQSGLFSTPKSMFMDNSTNPSDVIVTVSNTGQQFPIPAYSAGFYVLAVSPGSNLITLTSDGDATEVNNVQLFNYEQPSGVYEISPAGAGTSVTIANGADVALGDTTDAAVTNPALAATAIALLKGILTELGGGSLTWTQTVVNLAAGVSNNFLAVNANRKGLRWMNIGNNPCTIVPGVGPAVVGNGMQYNGSAGAGYQGGADSFTKNDISTQAFSGISTGGTTLVVWEGA